MRFVLILSTVLLLNLYSSENEMSLSFSNYSGSVNSNGYAANSNILLDSNESNIAFRFDGLISKLVTNDVIIDNRIKTSSRFEYNDNAIFEFVDFSYKKEFTKRDITAGVGAGCYVYKTQPTYLSLSLSVNRIIESNYQLSEYVLRGEERLKLSMTDKLNLRQTLLVESYDKESSLRFFNKITLGYDILSQLSIILVQENIRNQNPSLSKTMIGLKYIF